MNIRKGMSYLIEAFKLLSVSKNNDIALAIFGNGSPASLKDIEYPVYSLGNIKDELLLSICYSAADIFALPSLEDNLPNTALESMACGTPVVSFDTGGIPEMIRPELTGLLAKTNDIQDFANKIQWIVEHPKERMQMGKTAREVVEQEYTLEIQAKRYCDLYKAIAKR